MFNSCRGDARVDSEHAYVSKKKINKKIKTDELWTSSEDKIGKKEKTIRKWKKWEIDDIMVSLLNVTTRIS